MILTVNAWMTLDDGQPAILYEIRARPLLPDDFDYYPPLASSYWTPSTGYRHHDHPLGMRG